MREKNLSATDMLEQLLQRVSLIERFMIRRAVRAFIDSLREGVFMDILGYRLHVRIV